MGHSNVVTELAAGMKALPKGDKAFAQTQALWRFLHNERVTAAELVKPLLALAKAGCADSCDQYVLAMHDWSRLNYNRHHSKTDRLQMTHNTDVGYELQSSLLVADRDGAPIAAPAQNLVTKDLVISTYHDTACHGQSHLDELSERMAWLEQQGFAKPLVHLIDREGDSVAHLRQWEAAQQRWLVRVKAGSTVRWNGQNQALHAVAAALSYRETRSIELQGQPATQWLGETEVTLTRPAKPKRPDASGRRPAPQPGPALTARLVVSRIYDDSGKLLAEWYLLSNVQAEVGMEQLALWYYWRWRIESYFKLLKGAGQQLESWQQESGRALFNRLLIASQACTLVWRLLRAEGIYAEQTRAFLVRLSGRQMKRNSPVTAPALLQGLYMLFAMCDTLEHYSPGELAAFAAQAAGPLPSRRRGGV